MKPWLNRRNELGIYNTLLRELLMEDEGEYKNFLIMTPEKFDDLLNLIECDIKKYSTIMRNPIPPNIKLAATLRFLSPGANYAELQHMSWIHQSTISKFILEVCEAIYTRLKDTYLKVTLFTCIK